MLILSFNSFVIFVIQGDTLFPPSLDVHLSPHSVPHGQVWWVRKRQGDPHGQNRVSVQTISAHFTQVQRWSSIFGGKIFHKAGCVLLNCDFISPKMCHPLRLVFKGVVVMNSEIYLKIGYNSYLCEMPQVMVNLKHLWSSVIYWFDLLYPVQGTKMFQICKY